jgi:pimeloyl-ACP methyl ester carboxylesterase
MRATTTTVVTTHADIAVAQSPGRGMAVVFIHGNSSCKEAFRKQYEDKFGEKYRMIAMDLPGHGASSNAFDPAKTYSMPGYAAVVGEVLDKLKVDRAVIVGWSLGGHIAVEMLKSWPGVIGIMITGAPPVGRDMEAITAGFQPSPALFLAGKNELTAEEYKAFGDLTLGKLAANAELQRALHRTDGRARQMMFESLMAGRASDQRQLAETSEMPIAVVNGEKDPLVNLAYVGGLTYRTLWDDHCFVLRGLAHVPFIEAPEVFNPLLGRFLTDMEKRAAIKVDVRAPGGRKSGVAA